MPMTITFDEKALRTLTSPPRPSEPLRDIVLKMGKSNEINALASMGRDVLRTCVGARKYQPPVPIGFINEVDTIVHDIKLAKIAEVTGLLERLNVNGVATKPIDVAQILCAYIGAAWVKSFKEQGTNALHDSINDICSMLLDDDFDSGESTSENDGAQNMRKIPGIQQMPPVKPESPSPFPSMKGAIPEVFGRDDESVSSGRSPPPPLSYGAHYQQPYHSYYPPNPGMQPSPLHMHHQTPPQRFTSYIPGPAHAGPSFAQPQPHYASQPLPQVPPQTGPMPRGGYEYPGMPLQNPPGYNAPAPAPMFPPPPPPVAAQQSQGFISLFNELAMKNRMAISWQQQKSGQQHIPEWTMWLMVDGQAKGYGTASTKQAAKEIAAKVALQAMGWLNS